VNPSSQVPRATAFARQPTSHESVCAPATEHRFVPFWPIMHASVAGLLHISRPFLDCRSFARPTACSLRRFLSHDSHQLQHSGQSGGEAAARHWAREWSSKSFISRSWQKHHRCNRITSRLHAVLAIRCRCQLRKCGEYPGVISRGPGDSMRKVSLSTVNGA
jgi:hypothetical protein